MKQYLGRYTLLITQLFTADSRLFIKFKAVMKNLLGILLVFCSLFIPNLSQATHVLGIDAYASCTSKTGSTIKFTLTFIQLRDKTTSSVPFDKEIDVGIYGTSSRSLISVENLVLTEETDYEIPNASTFEFKIARFQATVSLPVNQSGYTLLYGRCCTRMSENLPNNIGTAILFEIPASISVGESTPKREDFGYMISQRNMLKTYDFPWDVSMFDSVHFESNRYSTFADENNPVPSPPKILKPLPDGLFKGSSSAGNPFGNNGAFTKLNDSQYAIQINKAGFYYYPITTTAFDQGDSFVSTRLLPLFVLDTILPALKLSLISYNMNNREAVFKAYSESWNYPGTVDLQRSTHTPPYNFTTLRSNIGDGFAIPLTDNSQQMGNNYVYRLARTGNGTTVYSDTVQTSNTLGVQNKIGYSSLKVYPNPSQNTLNLDGNILGSYQIYDLQGKLQLQGTKSEEIETISVEKLQPGIYFLKIGGSTYRIVKSN